MMDQLMMHYLQKPSTFNLRQMLGEEKWVFAKTLLETALEKKEYTTTLITPKLKNWDVERIAVLDMILMRMGVCELLYFETIPTKVTINCPLSICIPRFLVMLVLQWTPEYRVRHPTNRWCPSVHTFER